MALKSIGRSATVAFAPMGQFLAAGTMAGAIDQSFDSSASLEILKLDFASSDPDIPVLGSCATTERFNRLSWSSSGLGSEEYPYGVIAGGLVDGSINLFNPALLISADAGLAGQALIARPQKHTGAIRGLEFSTFSPYLLASGGDDGQLYIWNVTSPTSPSPFPPLESGTGAPAEISYLSWNRKVDHIVATTSTSGTSVVWDLRRQRPVISFSDPHTRKRFSSLQWNPDISTQLIVASDDNRSPALQVWDLRNSVAPLKELVGHTQGVLGMAWSPSDSSLLLTCAKDYKTLCWDTQSGEILSELPATGHWTFDVQWSPRTPGVLSTSSFDGKIQIWNIEACNWSLATDGDYGGAFGSVTPAATKKAPKWLKRPVGVTFGFGGKLATFVPKKVAPGVPPSSEIRLHTLITEEGLVKRSTEFEAAIAGGERSAMRSFCENKSHTAGSRDETEIWSFLKVMFEDDARKRLLSHLDFEVPENSDTKESVTPQEDLVSEELGQNLDIHDVSMTKHTEALPNSSSGLSLSLNGSFQAEDAEDFFNHVHTPKGTLSEQASRVESLDSVSEHTGEDHNGAEEQADAIDAESEEAIQRALVIGDFQKAVDQCLRVNRTADALILAFVGGTALWEKTRNDYIKRSHRPYLKVLSGVINNDLNSLVDSRPLKAWKETLALLCTYARSEDWTNLADSLAAKLDAAHETQAATLCYICAGNIARAVEIWSRDLELNHVGKSFVDGLQDLMEKTVVLSLATGQRKVSASLAKLVGTYAELLASQGLVDTAMEYLSMLSDEHSPQDLSILRDRLSSSRHTSSAEEVHETVEFSADVPSTESAAPVAEQRSYYQNLQVPSTESAAPVAEQRSYYQNDPRQVPDGHSYGYPQQSTHSGYPQQSIHSGYPVPDYVQQSYPAITTPAPAPRRFLVPEPQGPPGPPYGTSTQIPPSAQQSTIGRLQGSYPTSTPGQGFEPKQGPTVQPPSTAAAWKTPTIPGPPQSKIQPPYTSIPGNVAYPPGSRVQTIQPDSPPATNFTQVMAPPPTVQSVDTSNAAAELKPVVATLTKLFNETSEALGGSKANAKVKREIEDISRKLGALFVKLNSGDLSPNASAKLVQLCQYLHAGDYAAALHVQVQLTTSDWDECSLWLAPLKRMIKTRQTYR